MCRRYSSGSKDIMRLGENMWSDEWGERLNGDELDTMPQPCFQQVAELHESVERLPARGELHKQIARFTV